MGCVIRICLYLTLTIASFNGFFPICRMLPEYTEKISICNYRFLREFTKGVESQWVVNVVNHFKPNALNKV